MTKKLIVGVLVLGAASTTAFSAEPLDFNQDIRPILSDKCFSCHGRMPMSERRVCDSIPGMGRLPIRLVILIQVSLSMRVDCG